MAQPPKRSTDLDIVSPKNPQVKALLRLQERRERDKTGRFSIEGLREVTRAQQAGIQLEQLYICPDYLREEARASLRTVAADIPSHSLSQAAFTRLSYRENPDGVLAVAAIPNTRLEDVKLPEQALILVLAALEKPGNIGALLRTADAAGVDAVLLSAEGTDIYNPNVIRASMGSVFSRPVIAAPEAALRRWLQQQGLALVATTPHTEQLYWQVDYRASVAIILGSEHQGLEESWLEPASLPVRIPMQGLADSLNVATSGALLLYEALRQRQGA